MWRNAAMAVSFALGAIMTGVVTYACLQQPVWEAGPDVRGSVWFQATLVDIYLAFGAFYAWMFYKETAWWARIVGLILIVGLGSVAIFFYLALALLRLPSDAGPVELLTWRHGAEFAATPPSDGSPAG